MELNNSGNATLDTSAADITKATGSSKVSPYQKKINHLKKQIVFGLSVFAVIVVIITSFNFYDTLSQENHAEEISIIETEISDLKMKISGSEEKINDTKKYKQLWISANDKKKDFNGIKIADINNNFNSLAQQYKISEPTITISVPEVLTNGIYQLQTLDANLINCNISFNALTDRLALDFINDFIDDLPGYVIINDLTIKKNKKEGYNDQELTDISNGKFPGLVSTKISFSWYFLKRKPKPISQ